MRDEDVKEGLIIVIRYNVVFRICKIHLAVLVYSNLK